MSGSGDLKPLRSTNVIVIAVILIAGPALAYYINFHGGVISQNTEEWSRFGGYLGGVVAPLLSFASLIVLAQTAYELRERDKKDRETFRQEDRKYQQSQLDLQREYERTRIIFEMESKWEGMIGKRDQAAKVMKEHPYTDIRTVEQSDLPGREFIYETLGFFRTLEFAISEGVVLEKHAVALFGPVFVWWYIVGARSDYPVEWDPAAKLASLFDRMKKNTLFPEWVKYAEDELRDKFSGGVSLKVRTTPKRLAVPRRKKRPARP